MFFAGFDLRQEGLSVGGEVLLRHRNELDDTSVPGDPERFFQECLSECGVAFVGGGLDVAREGGDGDRVRRIEGASEKQAFRMRKVDRDERLGS